MLIDLALLAGVAWWGTLMIDKLGVTEKLAEKLTTKTIKIKDIDKSEKTQLDIQLETIRYKWINFFTATKLNDFKVINIEKISNGYKALLNVPVNKSTEDIVRLKSVIENYFECNSYISKIPYSSKAEVLLYTEKVNNYIYEPVKVDADHVWLGKDEQNNDFIVELKKDSHFMFPGITGSGKSFVEGIFLTNLLINNKNIDLYLYQIGKSELDRYKNVKQCKHFSNTLNDSAKYLQRAAEEINRRANLFAKYGIADIEQYNKVAHPSRRLNREFHVFDEISTYSKDGAELNEEEVELKEMCWAKLWNIVKMGRSVGIHFVGATQRITAQNLGGNGDLKSCITTLCLKMNNPNDSELALGNNDAIYLQDREMVYKGNKGFCKIKIATLDPEFKLLNHYIKDIKILDQNSLKELQLPLEDGQIEKTDKPSSKLADKIKEEEKLKASRNDKVYKNNKKKRHEHINK